MWTRKQYLAGECSMREYYLEIAEESGISYNNSELLPKMAKAKASGKHPVRALSVSAWDCRSIATRSLVEPSLLKRGDSWCIASGTMVHGTAAEVAFEKWEKENGEKL